MSHKNQLIKNTAIIAIGKISTQVLSYILLPLFSARMATNEYGTYDLVCTISVFLCPIITLQMEESMFRFLIDADSTKDRKNVISQTIIYTLIGIVLFIPISIIYLAFFTQNTASFIVVFVLFVISNIGIFLSNGLARGLSQIKLYSFSNVILGVSTIVLTIVMLLLNPSSEGMLWANTIANLLATTYLFVKLKLFKYIGNINKILMKQMIKYSAPLVPNSISWCIINMSDRIIISQLINAGANGIYAMASRFPNIINVLYGYFYTAWKESAAKIVKEENKNAYYNSIYHDMTKFLLAVTICLIAVMPFAFPIFINKNYNDAYQYIPIIIIATYYSCIASFYGGIFGAFKETRIMGTTTIIAAIINLIIDFSLIKYIGIYAACVSTLIADMVIYYYRRKKLRRLLDLRELNKVGPFIVLILVTTAYYTKFIPFISTPVYWILNVITLFIALAFSFKINKRFIQRFLYKIKTRKA